MTAQADPTGYLTEFSYDRSGNVLESVATPRPPHLAMFDRTTVTGAPDGAVALTSYKYDLANLVIEVRTPTVQVTDEDTHAASLQSMVTRFTYDKAGNVTQTT